MYNLKWIWGRPGVPWFMGSQRVRHEERLIWSDLILVVQWLRISLPMKWTYVWSLVWEDSACRGTTEPVPHTTEDHSLEPALRKKSSHRDETPARWEQRGAPARRSWRKPAQIREDPVQAKLISKYNWKHIFGLCPWFWARSSRIPRGTSPRGIRVFSGWWWDDSWVRKPQELRDGNWKTKQVIIRL